MFRSVRTHVVAYGLLGTALLSGCGAPPRPATALNAQPSALAPLKNAQPSALAPLKNAQPSALAPLKNAQPSALALLKNAQPSALAPLKLAPPKPVFTLDTPVDRIAADPDGKAILDRDIPGVMASKEYPLFDDMSLTQIALMSGGRLSKDKLDLVRTDLVQLSSLNP